MTREEAIKNIKLFFTGINIALSNKTKEALDVLIPELRESEDERTRKGLIEALKASKTVGELKFILPEPTREECIAYLEKQKEQKPAEWSEEDEKMLNNLIWAVHMKSISPCDEMDDRNVYEKYESFLKSLRPSLKSSEEQMEALRTAMDRNDSIGYNLRQLYEQLKKLM